MRTTLTIGETFYTVRASEINVGALLIEIAKLNLNPENKAKFDRLSSEHSQIDDALDRWEAPGEKNTPSALDRLIDVDFKLPDDFIMLTLRSSSDVMSVQLMGILPKRTFDIDAAATVVVSAIDPNAKVTRVIKRATCRLKVDPRKSVTENLEPSKEQGSQKCEKSSSDSAP